MAQRWVSEKVSGRVIELAAEVQQVAAPTFAEAARAEFVQRLFAAELPEAGMDAAGNVYARLPGSGKRKPLVVSAHLDTVFPAGTDLTLRQEDDSLHGPGIGDNSMGIAGLFGLLWGLRERGLSLPGDVWLVANTCEEGLGDLRGMRAVVERFGAQVQFYLVLEGMALGQVYHRGLGVRRYRINVQTCGGHSWVDYGRASAIHELAELVVNLKNLPLPKQPRASLNVGVIAGGTSINTIASQAHLELDLRSESPATLDSLAAHVETLVQSMQRGGPDFVHPHLDVIGSRPAGEMAASHPLVHLATECLQALGVTPRLHIGSTDANLPLSLGLPAITLGLTLGSGSHTTGEFIYKKPVRTGLTQLVNLVAKAWSWG